MPKNNSDIAKDVEHIRHTEQLDRQIRELETRLYRADVHNSKLLCEKEALEKINAELQSQVEKLRGDNTQLLEQYDQLAAKCQAKPSQYELDICRELNESLRLENEKLRGEK